MKNHPHVSVIIPARNEAVNIKICLQALVTQEKAPHFEVVVVDNASTDGTGAVVRQFQKQHPELTINLIVEPTPGRGTARAAGFKAARGKILLSTDADSIVPPHWVATLSSALENTTAVAVTTGTRIVDCSPLTNIMFNYSRPLMWLYRAAMGHWWLTGSTFGIKRQPYELSGGFDPACTDLEDIDLGWRVSRVGRIKYLPSKTILVITGGDRYQQGLIRGMIPYVKAYVGRFWLRQGDRFARRD